MTVRATAADHTQRKTVRTMSLHCIFIINDKNDIEVINTKIPANIVYSETYTHNN